MNDEEVGIKAKPRTQGNRAVLVRRNGTGIAEGARIVLSPLSL